MMCASLKVLSTGKDGDNLKRRCHPNAQNKEINLQHKDGLGNKKILILFRSLTRNKIHSTTKRKIHIYVMDFC